MSRYGLLVYFLCIFTFVHSRTFQFKRYTASQQRRKEKKIASSIKLIQKTTLHVCVCVIEFHNLENLSKMQYQTNGTDEDGID